MCWKLFFRLIRNITIVSASVLLINALFIQPLLATVNNNPQSLCQNNLRQFGKSLMVYCGDYDGRLPSSVLYRGTPGQTDWNPDNFQQFACRRGELPPQAGAGVNSTPESWPMTLYHYMENIDIIWCPSDRNKSSNPNAVVSYYWKAAVDYGWFNLRRHEANFLYPHKQTILYERTGWHRGRANKGLVDGVTINCCYLDGHVAAVVIRDSGYTATENPPGPLPKSGIGEPAWYNYSFGEDNPEFSKNRNWDPEIWGDNLKEVEQPGGQTLLESDSTCQNNLKHLSTALLAYCADWDGCLPSSVLYGGSKLWNPDDFTQFAARRGTFPTGYGYNYSHCSWPMLLSPYIRQKSIIWCPSDKGKSDDPDAFVSYYWKAAVDAAWYGGPEGTGPEACKLPDFSFPAMQMILYERAGWHYGRHNSGLADRVRINCTFLDGHVSPVEIRDSGYTRFESPAGPLPASGIGEPAWFNYSYGDASPAFSKWNNWNPRVWVDRFDNEE